MSTQRFKASIARDAGYVALYIGRGKIIHAADESTGIISSNYNYSKPVKAMRYWLN